MRNKLLTILISLITVSTSIFAQIGDANIFLKNGSEIKTSILLVQKKAILTSDNKGIPFLAIDSLITKDSMLVFSILQSFPSLPMSKYDDNYKIDFSTAFPTPKVEFLKEDTLNNITSSYYTKAPLVEYEYPYGHLIPLSIVAFYLAWDYYVQARDIQTLIDGFSKTNKQIEEFNKLVTTKMDIPLIDTSKLESTKVRKIIFATTFLISGIFNTIIALKRVEVKANSNSLSLVYHF